MKNSPNMKTGSMPSVSQNRNVNGQNKSSRMVNSQNLMVQGESRARMNRMDLNKVSQHPVESGDVDCASEYN